jgi:hypothetical protein
MEKTRQDQAFLSLEQNIEQQVSLAVARAVSEHQDQAINVCVVVVHTTPAQQDQLTKQDVQAIVDRSVVQSEQRIKQHLDLSEQREVERDEGLYSFVKKRLNFIRSALMFLKRRISPRKAVATGAIAGGGGIFAYWDALYPWLCDVKNDLVKEVIKKSVENKLDVIAEMVTSVLHVTVTQGSGLFAVIASVGLPLCLNIKTATAFLRVAVDILNHTVSVCAPFRRGLVLVRNILF